MIILISDAFDDSLEKKLSEFATVTTDKNRLSEADVVLVRSKTKCTKEYIDQGKNLKLIIRGGVGIDNIDKDYAQKKNIIVRNTPKSSATAVSELSFALMLSIPNKLFLYHNGMKEGQWLKKEKRTELYGKTLCCLGFGNIAKSIALKANAFGMKSVAYRRSNEKSDIADIKDNIVDAVKDAHYISLNLPSNDETKEIVNYDLIKNFKNKPIIINTGRESVINANDIKRGLEEGLISWYATDVYPSDPPSPDYPLLSLDKVTLTPHVGANTNENLLRIGDEAYDIIKEIIKEGKLK